MEYLWRVPVAIVGILLLRRLVYPRRWGHRSILDALTWAAGVAMVTPLVRYSRAGTDVALALAVIALLPYRRMVVAAVKWKTHVALRQLAREWGTKLHEDPKTGLCEIVSERSSRRIRIANVLTFVRSLHPGVRKSEVGYMLGYVVELRRPASFQCSLMRGWETPKYFEREWRTTCVMQGDFLALSWNGLLDEACTGRATGGKGADLSIYPDLTDPRLSQVRVMGTRPEQFSRVFSGDFLDDYLAIAWPGEVNVTPSSVNLLGAYGNLAIQKSCIAFLETLANAVEGLGA